MPGAGSWNATLAAAVAALNSKVIDSRAYVLRSTRLVPATSVGVALPVAIGAECAASGRAVEEMGVMQFLESNPEVIRFQRS